MKKLGYSAASAAIVFFVLWGLGALVSAYIVYAAFALTAGVLVYTRVALWEITRATAGLVK